MDATIILITFLLSGAIVIYVARKHLPAVYANGRCGCGPNRLVSFGENDLAIPWYTPVPGNAKVALADAGALAPVSDAIGVEAETSDARYSTAVTPEAVFNPSISSTIDQIHEWDRRYSLPELSAEPVAAFSDYLNDGFMMFHALVEHPAVTDDFKAGGACSVVSQRGDIYYIGGRQDLFLQSKFHNASLNNRDEFVNLAPDAVLHSSFETNKIWYPLALTKLQKEPTSVVLNIMADREIGQNEVPKGFRVAKSGRVRNGIQKYVATQLVGRIEGGASVTDVSIGM